MGVLQWVFEQNKDKLNLSDELFAKMTENNTVEENERMIAWIDREVNKIDSGYYDDHDE